MIYGAAAGDIAGSRFEFHNIKTKQFKLFSPDCRFTDDTVMTFAVAVACETYKKDRDETSFRENLIDSMHRFGSMYPDAGYGGRFTDWLTEKLRTPYNSWGNGSAMRVSPVAYCCDSLEETRRLAAISAAVTHNHPEGIAGAQITASCVFLALHGGTKDDIRRYTEETYAPLDFTLDEIRPSYTFDVSCRGTVPQAIQCFLESENVEDAIRNAVSIGGDCDTSACIAGSIAEAYYGIGDDLRKGILPYLDEELTGLLMQLNK